MATAWIATTLHEWSDLRSRCSQFSRQVDKVHTSTVNPYACFPILAPPLTGEARIYAVSTLNAACMSMRFSSVCNG